MDRSESTLEAGLESHGGQYTMSTLSRMVRLTAIVASLAFFASNAAEALATGTLTINRTDGTVDTYDDVTVNVFTGSLFLTTADGKGTLVVNRSACSYQAKLIVCLPTSVVLVQNGKSNALTLTSGTIYLNYTNDPQPLSLSSAKVPPRAALVSFTIASGAYVNLSGTLDQVIKQ
jgi:hypothetical protein